MMKAWRGMTGVTKQDTNVRHARAEQSTNHVVYWQCLEVLLLASLIQGIIPHKTRKANHQHTILKRDRKKLDHTPSARSQKK